MSIARYAAFPLGAAIGGALVATIGPGWALLLDGATYATSALLLAMIDLPRRAAVAATNFIRELREGWDAFTEHTWVWLLTGWISLYFLVTYAPFFVLGPYVAKHSTGGRFRLGDHRHRRGIGIAPRRARRGLRLHAQAPDARDRRVLRRDLDPVRLLALKAPPALDRAARRCLAGIRVLVRHRSSGRRRSSRRSPRTSWSRRERLQLDGRDDLPPGPGTRSPGRSRSRIGISTSLWIGGRVDRRSRRSPSVRPGVRNVRVVRRRRPEPELAVSPAA
jgi:hypothetical protein